MALDQFVNAVQTLSSQVLNDTPGPATYGLLMLIFLQGNYTELCSQLNMANELLAKNPGQLDNVSARCK